MTSEKIEKLILHFENCENITVYANEVNYLFIENISQSKSLTKENELTTLFNSGFIAISINEQIEKRYDEIKNELYYPVDFKNKVLRYLNDRKDLVGVSIFYKNGTEDNIVAFWAVDSNSMSVNSAQTNLLTTQPDGDFSNLEIKVADKRIHNYDDLTHDLNNYSTSRYLIEKQSYPAKTLTIEEKGFNDNPDSDKNKDYDNDNFTDDEIATLKKTLNLSTNELLKIIDKHEKKS